jgi:hypothetical protein
MENLMTQSSLARLRLGRIVLLGASAFALGVSPFAVGEAAARVGVTSATDGDPLGKPPQEAERVLRIGIDVQANELITTNANDRAHLLFLDGSSLTVGPNAQLTIDKFVFDPNTKTGELSINATKGVLRMVGGKISKNTPINITTPSSTIGIRGGITIMDVSAAKTDSTFVFGKDMTVRGAGQTQVATRPGSLIVTSLGSPPGQPTLLPQGGLTAQLGALEGRRAAQGSSGGASTGGGSGRNPDQVAQTSGLSGVNSSQSVRIVAPGVPDNFGSGPGPRNRNPSDTVVTALSNANQEVQSNTATQAQTTTPSPFDMYNDRQYPFLTAFDLNKLNIAPNSTLSTVNELSNLNAQRATATYNGPVMAWINGSRIDGTYQNAWNFGNRNGVATIKIDNSTYSGTTSLIGNGPFFSGRLPSTGGPARSADVGGGFLSSPGKPAGQQVGGVVFSGQNYKGFGVFSGTR